jgi:hypothetical protein
MRVECLKEEQLNLARPMRRVRALEILSDKLVVHPVDDGDVTVSWADLILIVQGRLVVSRVEVEEKRRRGRAKPLSTRELFADEPLLDLYLTGDEIGWRISAGSFDFSCLKADKAVTAFENWARLVSALRERAPDALADDSFHALRALLAKTAPAAPEDTRRERRRTIRGKIDALITMTSNEAQFNCYSRLRHRLELLRLEGGR